MNHVPASSTLSWSVRHDAGMVRASAKEGSIHHAATCAIGRRHLSSLSSKRSGQRGVALVVALLLLVVITLVGLAAVRGTIMQQKMAANLFDRQIAFQSAEAAMRAAQARVAANPDDIARNCQAGGVFCQSNPFDDPNLPAGKIITVASGTGDGQFVASSLAASKPQYVIENMGNWYDPNSSTGYNQSANAHNYGASSPPPVVYYRVTARSGNPVEVGDRSVVVLQAMIKQG